MKTKNTLLLVLQYLVIAVCIIGIMFPMYLTIVTAFKSPSMIAKSFFALPDYLYIDNFRTVFTDSNFFQYLANSFYITVVSVGIIVIMIPATAYAIVRNSKKRYYKVLHALIIAGIFVPFYVIMIPCVKIASSLGMMSSSGVILFYLAFSLGTYTFLMEGYIKSIPYELEESAIIDGASVLQRFAKIVYPVITPMIATVAILVTLWIWNDFLMPLVMLNKDDSYWTLTLFQYNFRNSYGVDYNLAFASFFASIIPVTIVYMFLQKYIISGLTQGALKG
ncbi:MAG: carbohydrate ABC transporter permease [Ruminiclostridium sp.]